MASRLCGHIGEVIQSRYMASRVCGHLINWPYLLLSRPTLGGSMEALGSRLYKYYIAPHGAAV